MLATEQFRLVMRPDVKQKLAELAQMDGRSKAKMIERLILERYETVQTEKPVKKNQARSQRDPARV